MSYNPYDQSGFSDNFARGFGLALDQQKQSMQNKEMQAQTAARQQEIGLRGQEVALAGQREQREAGLTQAQINDMNQQGRLRQSQADQADAEFKAKQPYMGAMAKGQVDQQNATIQAEQARAAAGRAQAGLAGTETQKNQAEMARDQQVQGLNDALGFVSNLPDDNADYNKIFQTGRNMDAFIRVGAPKGMTPDKFNLNQGDVNQLHNHLFARELSVDNGKQLNDSDLAYAKQTGAKVSPGASIVGRQWVDQHFNQANGNAIVPIVNVQVKNKDGSFSSFQEPWTDQSTGLVRQIPLNAYEQKIAGVGHLQDAMDKYQTQTGEPLTKQALSQTINSHLNAVKAVNPSKYYKTDRYGDVIDTGNQSVTPNLGRPSTTSDPTKNKYTAAILKMQSDPYYSTDAKALAANTANLKNAYKQETGKDFDEGASQAPSTTISGNPSQLGAGGTSQQGTNAPAWAQ